MATAKRTTKRAATPNPKNELAALATLLGVMSTAAKLSEQLLQLSDEHIGRSVDVLMQKAGLSIEEIQAQTNATRRAKPRRK